MCQQKQITAFHQALLIFNFLTQMYTRMVARPPRIGVGPGFDSQGSVTFFHKYCFPNLHWIHWANPWWSDSAIHSSTQVHDFNISIKKCLAKKEVFVASALSQALSIFPLKSAWKKVFVASAFRTIPGTLDIFRKIAWQKNSFYLHYPRHFQNVHKKCLTKNSLHPHVPRHILFFQKKFLTKSVIYFCTSPGTYYFFCS